MFLVSSPITKDFGSRLSDGVEVLFVDSRFEECIAERLLPDGVYLNHWPMKKSEVMEASFEKVLSGDTADEFVVVENSGNCIRHLGHADIDLGHGERIDEGRERRAVRGNSSVARPIEGDISIGKEIRGKVPARLHREASDPFVDAVVEPIEGDEYAGLVGRRLFRKVF